MAVLDAAVEAGVTFFDTADVYGDGRSEQLIGAFLRNQRDQRDQRDQRSELSRQANVTVATKMGRRAPLDPAEYTPAAFRAWTDRSRRNLQVDTLDLVQLHCPPEDVFHDDAVFDALDDLVTDGRIRAYGVSVETCDQALSAIARPGLTSVQIILNAFRRKPLEAVLPAAAAAGVAVIARVPLASGLLSGRYRHDTAFAATDHRAYNRHGEAFDVGETFAGVDYDTGVEAAREFSDLVERSADGGPTPAQVALHWIVQQPGVTTVIPGARSVEQVRANAAAASIPDLNTDLLTAMSDLYDRRIRPSVHDRW